jgi:hydroxypyruvate reductase
MAPRRVDLLIASDVLGDDPAYIGSGPCTPDSLTAAKVLRMLERTGAAESVPESVRRYLDDVHHQRIPETPKPGSGVFRSVHTTVVLSNRTAVGAASAAAARRGFAPVRVISQPLKGEARDIGTELGSRLVGWRQQLIAAGTSTNAVACTIAGGETTVTLGATDVGLGGRCQEMALAIARELHRLRPRSNGIALLIAGTDGRDGPTDAAGAIVDASTWARIQDAGRDPDTDLRTHNTNAALDAAGALLRTGPTGTNLNDLVIAAVPVTPGA